MKIATTLLFIHPIPGPCVPILVPSWKEAQEKHEGKLSCFVTNVEVSAFCYQNKK